MHSPGKSQTTRASRRGRPSTPFLRERIVEAASELFGNKDFDRVSIDDIAALARTGKGSVYRQFGSKEELYVTIVIEDFTRLQSEIRAELRRATSLNERVRAMVYKILTFFWNRRQLFALLRDPTALPRRLERQYRAERDRLADLVRSVLDEGVKAGAIRSDLDTKVATETILGMLRGIIRYCREYTSPEGAAETVTSIFLSGAMRRAHSLTMTEKVETTAR
ncbi:MAG TPA: TetR/AcrR family transcriptional regulator [Candidatus Binataceae bacterium]|nr:TetR/AcrR family transcriptional regulator [Candidatus Binataceae bacterium]